MVSFKQLKNLSALPADQLERLNKNLSVKSIKKNGAIFDQGDNAKLVYLLLSGVVKVSHNGHERQTIVSMLSPGDFFGFDSLVPHSRHPFRCSAYETSTVGSMSPRDFVEVMLGSSYERFLPGFAATLQLTGQLYVHCVRGIPLDLRRRIALELVNLADRFGAADPRGTLITLAISHETLAEIVGASRQQVTEYLNDFDRDRLIHRDGRRIVVNSEQLRRIIASKR